MDVVREIDFRKAALLSAFDGTLLLKEKITGFKGNVAVKPFCTK